MVMMNSEQSNIMTLMMCKLTKWSTRTYFVVRSNLS